MGQAESPAGARRTRVRSVLLVLLWAWALLMFVVVDLFFNVEEFDRVRPRSPLYQGMRITAHAMVGHRVEGAPEVSRVKRTRVRSPTAPMQALDPETADPARLLPAWRAEERLAHVEHGTYTQWNDPDGPRTAGTYEDGQRAGRWAWCWPDGRLREERHYENGRLHGVVRSWYPNGYRERVEHYVAGRREGRWQVWYPDGTVASVESYRDGNPDGEFGRWYPDGRLAAQREFVEGAASGSVLLWHGNGRLELEGSFREGKKDGLWRTWDELGTPEGEVVYEAGRAVRASGDSGTPRIGSMPFRRAGWEAGTIPGEEVR